MRGSHEDGDREVLREGAEEETVTVRIGELGVFSRGNEQVVVLVVRANGSLMPTEMFLVGVIGETVSLELPINELDDQIAKISAQVVTERGSEDE